MGMTQRKSLQIQLLSVPDCPLVESARSALKNSLAQTHIDTVVEELVGDYSSPTILVDGFDVTGRPREPKNQASCRLDLPTEEQILVALRGLSVVSAHSQDGFKQLHSAFFYKRSSLFPWTISRQKWMSPIALPVVSRNCRDLRTYDSMPMAVLLVLSD